MNLVRSLFIILASGLVVIAATAEAGVSVVPDRHIIELEPGRVRTVEYQIHNSGPQDLNIEVDPKDWSGIEDGQGTDISQWLSLEQDKLEVKAGQGKPLRVKVTSPENVNGELLAMLFLCYKQAQDSPLNIRNGIPLYLVIKGTEDYDAKIEGIKLRYRKGRRNDRLSLNIRVRAKNTGNIHINPDLDISIKNSDGEEVRQLRLKKSQIILRGKGHTYNLDWWDPVLPEGRYTVVATLSYQDKIKETGPGQEFEIKDGKVIRP